MLGTGDGERAVAGCGLLRGHSAEGIGFSVEWEGWKIWKNGRVGKDRCTLPVVDLSNGKEYTLRKKSAMSKETEQ